MSLRRSAVLTLSTRILRNPQSRRRLRVPGLHLVQTVPLGRLQPKPEARNGSVRNTLSGSRAQYRAIPLVRVTVLASLSAAFRKQYAMDFYITKYQGKPMEALTPLFQAMTSGVHRLEQQERDEEQRAQAAAPHDDAHTPSEPAAKQRKTLENLARRAGRLTIRLASMANRCYWLSATEVAVHLLTGGDCLQSHQHQRLFTRQLQWALHECKRAMNGEKGLERLLPTSA